MRAFIGVCSKHQSNAKTLGPLRKSFLYLEVALLVYPYFPIAKT